jgi:hypothetical protein
MLLRMHPNLHRDYQERTTFGVTHMGQAGVADGLSRQICDDCRHWGLTEKRSARRTRAPCMMFKKLTGRVGPDVPKDAHICQYFEALEGKGL